MNIVEWDPFRSLLDFRNLPLGQPSADGESRGWAPAVDIYEVDDALVMRAEVPGVAREDLDLSVDKGVLTLTGERKLDERLSDAQTYRRERFYGQFTRRFTLPDNVDASQIAASFRDGVLEIRIPRSEAARPRKIAVDAA